MRYFSGCVLFIFALLLLLVPLYIAPPCLPTVGKPPMKCFWMSRAAICDILVMLCAASCVTFVKENMARAVASLLYALLSIIVVFLPFGIIGVCKVATMPCRILTSPMLMFLGSISAVVGLAMAWQFWRNAKRRFEHDSF